MCQVTHCQTMTREVSWLLVRDKEDSVVCIRVQNQEVGEVVSKRNVEDRDGARNKGCGKGSPSAIIKSNLSCARVSTFGYI